MDFGDTDVRERRDLRGDLEGCSVDWDSKAWSPNVGDVCRGDNDVDGSQEGRGIAPDLTTRRVYVSEHGSEVVEVGVLDVSRFHSSAKRIILGPLAPTAIGRPAGRGPRGRNTQSRAW